MKTYQIILFDKVLKEAEKVESFSGNEDALKKRLYDLQLGYCEGSEKPNIISDQIKSNGMLYNYLIAHSDVDFSYISVLSKAS